MQSAMSAHAAGRLDQAQDLCRQVLAVNPRHIQSMLLSGVLASKTGQRQAAADWFRRVLSIEQKNYVALNWMSMLSRESGDITQATAFSELAAEVNPKDPDVVNGLGLCYAAQGRFEDAIEWFSRAVTLQPRNASYHSNLGVALGMAGQTADAVEQLRSALRMAPDPNALRNLVDLLLSLGDADAAVAVSREVVAAAPRAPALKLLLASTLLDAGLAGEARAVLLQFPDSPDAREMLGRLLQEDGRFDEATQEYEEAVFLDQRRGLSYYGLVTCAGNTDAVQSLADRIDFALEVAVPDALPTAHMQFALGAALDRLSRPEEAMRRFDEANRICRGLLLGARPFEADGLARQIDATIELFSPEFVEASRETGAATDSPIFVTGIMNSGAWRLQEQLAAHPAIGAAGDQMFGRQSESEIVDWNAGSINAAPLELAVRHYEARLRAISPDTRFVTDTSPTQIMQLGLLHIAFPRSRVLHIVQDRSATIRSTYTTPVRNAPDFACDMQNIAFAHDQFQRLMDHWKKTLPTGVVLEVRLEDLIRDRETELPRILSFLGLEWDPACLTAVPVKAPRAADFWHFRHHGYWGA